MPSGSKIRSCITSPNPLAADRFHDLACPVHIAAVFPLVSGIEQERRHDRRLRGRDYARLAVLLGEAIVALAEEVIAEAGSVQHQHARGDVALRCPELRLACRIKPVEHLQLADIGRVGFRGGVEVKLAFLDALHHGRTRDRLGRGENGEDGVGRHVGDELTDDILEQRLFARVGMKAG
jgi:hypothetical protein